MFKLSDAEIEVLTRFVRYTTTYANGEDENQVADICNRLLKEVDADADLDRTHWERVHILIMASIITAVIECATDQDELLFDLRKTLIYHRINEPKPTENTE